MPGASWSSCFDRMPETHPDPGRFVRVLDARAPMNRVAEPIETAQAILWRASGESSFAAGSTLTAA
ncbi:hypothetical protein LXM94_04775 [Rhizobium sp. TRM95111]|nr:hypothetical protein [Rhizobium alarense]MCF3639275.1 hypothetical protein [Rhizobium alarense]